MAERDKKQITIYYEAGKKIFESRIPNARLKVHTHTTNWGHAVAQLVEALYYKSEGRGFDSRWCQLNFSLT